VPSLEELLVILMAQFDNSKILSNAVIDLLHWILVEFLKYDIETVPKAKHEDILSLSKSTGNFQIPKDIFRVVYRDSSAAEKKFKQLRLGQQTKFAYHGTKFSTIYTILNYGLQQHLNKTALFGVGLYFSFEVQVSLLFSQSVSSWSRSKLGDLVSSVAICEYIDDPNYSKIRKENAKNSDIPQNYLLITNNEIVRVRYLMIYGTNKPPVKSSVPGAATPSGSEVLSGQRSFFTWCRKNPLIVSACLYVMLLGLVGFSNHRSFEHYKKIVLDFLTRRFKFE
jgi:poly[ADP-ribose] polymerase 16